MGDAFDERLGQFLALLRAAPATRSPGRGLGRVARTARGMLGMASSVWSSRRGGGSLDEGDLRALEALVTQLGELKGLPMKVGQILGYLEADLPEEMRRLLALLQTQSRPLAFERIEQVLRADLGSSAEPLLARLERAPVSTASIGQVHRGSTPEGASVAVKVRHPEIEDAIRSDFRAASAGTAFARLLVPAAGATAREVAAEAEARLLEECDYRLEAERQRLFGRLYAGHPDLAVPSVYAPWCGPRVLTTSWEGGEGFEQFAARASQPERDRAGRALFEFYVGTLYRHGLFHADPHPGNYQVRADGKVVVFDYGCVRQFDAEAVRAFVALAEAVREDDARGVRAALVGLGAEPPKDPRAFAHVRSLMRGFFAPMLEPGVRRMDGRVALDVQQMTRDKLAVARLRLPGKFLFLFRIRFGLYSVLSRLGAVADWSALERGFVSGAAR